MYSIGHSTFKNNLAKTTTYIKNLTKKIVRPISDDMFLMFLMINGCSGLIFGLLIQCFGTLFY